MQELQDALRAGPHELRAVAHVMSKAYFNCQADLGPEAPAISAALKGSEEMETQQRAMIDEYVEIMCRALRPFSPLGTEKLRLTCIGLLGAAEAIAREGHNGRASDVDAIDAFSSFITKSIEGPSR